MKIVDIADEIFRELDQPLEVSIPQISYWVRVNIGMLNNLIYTEYAIDTATLEINPDLGIEEKAILKKLYAVHFYDMKIRNFMGENALDAVVEVMSDGAKVRKVNRNQTSQIIVSVRKHEQENLDKLIESYKSLKSPPMQVAGDDTVAGAGIEHSDLNRLKSS
tara:strand:- start:472 stop:960 length:489 start_codon:yes stop_codon:yes gene_type:complete